MSNDIVVPSEKEKMEWQHKLAEPDIDFEGFILEDRPVSGNIMRSLRYRGKHLDTCIKTEDGWICTDTCRIEERGGNRLRKTIDTPLKVMKSLEKIRFLKYRWEIKQQYETRIFYDGRSFRTKNQEIKYHEFGSGYTMLKFKSKKKIIDCLEKNMLDAKEICV